MLKHIPDISLIHENSPAFACVKEGLTPANPAEQQFDEATFTLTAGSLCLYTAGLSEDLAKVMEFTDTTTWVKGLIASSSRLPRQ